MQTAIRPEVTPNNQLIAIELLDSQRNTLLRANTSYLVQVINLDENSSHSVIGITVFQDCLEVMNFGIIDYQTSLLPQQVVLENIKKRAVNQTPLYFANHFGLNYVPIGTHQFFPTDDDSQGYEVYRPLFMATAPFKSYTLLS